MNKGLLVLLLLAMDVGSTARAADFTVCESTYALCTTAECTPLAGREGWVSCTCSVHTGYSAGAKPCPDAKDTSGERRVSSRYYPIRSYARCSNARPWAWCLDSPCVIDARSPTEAACTCSVVQNQGDYVIVTDTYTASTCETGLYSSATVTQLDQVTDFLRRDSALPPFPIKVLNPKP